MVCAYSRVRVVFVRPATCGDGFGFVADSCLLCISSAHQEDDHQHSKELHFSRILNLRQKKQVILIPHSLHTEYHCDQHTCNPVNLNHDLGRALTRMASGSTRSTTGFPAARLLPVFFLLLYSTGMTPLPPPPYLIHLRLLMGCHALRNPTTRCAASLQCPHELVASCPRHLC